MIPWRLRSRELQRDVRILYRFLYIVQMTRVMKIREEIIDDNPLDSQARYLYSCIHRCSLYECSGKQCKREKRYWCV